MPITESLRAVARPSTTDSTASTTSPAPAPPPAATAAPLPWRGLLALSAAVFLSITGEMLPTGLMPDMSASLGVGEPLVGLLVSVFAFTVVVTSAPLTALTRRMPRRTLLVGVLVVLAVTTIVCAFAPEYWMLVVARIVGGIAHGLFWALVGAYAARLVPEGQIGRAVSVTLGGGTLALIVGVPAATALGQAIGWRAVFGVVGALTLAGALVVWWALRSTEARVSAAARLSGEHGATDAAAAASVTDTAARAAVTRGATRAGTGMSAVLLVCVVTAITMVGQYAVLTYVAPILTDVVGAPSTWVAPLLLVSGVAGAAGLVVAGSSAARRANRAMLAAMAVVIVSLVVLSLSPGLWAAIIAFVVWGFAFGAIPPLLQTRLLQAAAPERRDAAGALYTTAFNVGIGGGALVGGVLFDAFGVEVLPAAYAIMLLIAGTIVAVTAARAGQPRTASAGGPVRPSAT